MNTRLPIILLDVEIEKVTYIDCLYIGLYSLRGSFFFFWIYIHLLAFDRYVR
jgi:hypothetical protein